MDGKEIFDFSAFNVPEAVTESLCANGLTIEDIDLFVFHQANQYMLNFIRMRSKIPQEKFLIDMADGGNTVSSTIPIALSRYFINHRSPNISKLLLCGFGVGLSIGCTLLNISNS